MPCRSAFGSGTWVNTTTPPGETTRAISKSAARLNGVRSTITWLTLPSAKGMASALPIISAGSAYRGTGTQCLVATAIKIDRSGVTPFAPDVQRDRHQAHLDMILCAILAGIVCIFLQSHYRLVSRGSGDGYWKLWLFAHKEPMPCSIPI